MLSCLWGQVDFSPKKWLMSADLGKQPTLKENQILKFEVYYVLNGDMYNVNRYFKAILLCSWTNPEFKPITMMFFTNMQFDDHNTDPIPSVIKSQ